MHHGGAFNYNINLSGQAGEGSTKAVEVLRAAYAKLLTTLDDAGIPVGGILTGKVEPVIDPVDQTAKGDAVIHDAAADVLLAEAEKATASKATKAAGRKARKNTDLTKDQLRAKIEKADAKQPPADAKKTTLVRAANRADKAAEDQPSTTATTTEEAATKAAEDQRAAVVSQPEQKARALQEAAAEKAKAHE